LSEALETIRLDHFAFLHGGQTLSLLGGWARLTDWNEFAASWNRLELDTYMADGGRYRRRRHAVYAVQPGERILRQPHQPHYQTLDYNRLNGGIPRHFEPIEAEIAAGASMSAILAFCRDLFEGLSPIRAWHVELHQFRIEAGPGQAGQPTPEGMHRDGVDFVLVLLIGRQNIASGMTTIHDLQKNLLGSFTLTDPLDAALVDDRLVYHGVTPVEPLDPGQPAHRDVLVVTFRAR
jgi:hypothetical protein